MPDAFTAVQWMRAPGGAATPSFCERVKVLLTGGAKPPAPHVAPVELTSAPASVARSTPRWMKPVLASAVLLAVVLAVTLFRRSNHDEAKLPPSAPVPSIPVAEKLSPARQLTERARAILDHGNLNRAQIDAAIELCDRALQLDPADPLVWVQAARADLLLIFPYGFDRSDERRKRAQERATRAASLAPDLLEVKLIQAAVFAHAVATPALIAEAEKTIRALIVTHPNDPELVRQLADVLREAQRFDEAAKLFESIGEFEVAGWSYYLAGELRAALPAVERSPRTVSGLELRATLQYSANEDLDAAQAVVAQFQPSELLAEMPAGVALRIAVYRRDSTRILELAQGLAPDYLASFVFNGPRRYFTGLAHEIAGRTAQAEAEWRAALAVVDTRLKSAPDDRELLLWSAWLHAVLHHTAEAEKQFAHSQAIAGLPGDTMDTLNFRVLQRLGKKAALLAGEEKQLRARAPQWEMVHAEMRFSPEFDFMRDDPQFQKLLRENLPPGAKPLESAKPADETQTTASSMTPAVEAKSIAVLPWLAGRRRGTRTTRRSSLRSTAQGVSLRRKPRANARGYES